jgi:oligo-1,6-glucosidase
MAYHFETVDMSRTTEGYKLADFKEVFSKVGYSFFGKWLDSYIFI